MIEGVENVTYNAEGEKKGKLDWGKAAKKTAELSNANIEKAIKVIPSWVPIVPGYLKFKKREFDAMVTAVSGFDPSKSEKVEGGLKERVKRAVALEGEALVAGAGSVIDVLSTVASLGGGKAANETAKVVVGEVSKGKGAEVIVDSTGKIFTKLAGTLKNETARNVLSETGRLWGSIAENKAARSIVVGVIKESGILSPIEKEVSGSEGRQKVIDGIAEATAKINSGFKKESKSV